MNLAIAVLFGGSTFPQPPVEVFVCGIPGNHESLTIHEVADHVWDHLSSKIDNGRHPHVTEVIVRVDEETPTMYAKHAAQFVWGKFSREPNE